MQMNGFLARYDFDNATDIFCRAFGWSKDQVVNEFLLTQTDICLEQALTANNNLYTFPVLVNIQSQGGTLFNTEIRLNPQDTFLPQYIGFYLLNPSSATDTTFRPYTWANPAVFTNATQMQCIYNGTMKIAVNNRNYITNWQMNRHMVLNQTQQTAPLGAGSPGDQIDGLSDAFAPLQPYVLVSGSSNMEISVKLPVPPSAVDANSRIRMVMRGAIAYNSTVTT